MRNKLFITVVIILFCIVCNAQYSPTSAKTRFVNGISLGTKLDAYYNSADSNAIYWRADSVLRAKYRGMARTLAFIDNLSDSIIWGNISGLLNNQTDLRDTLLGKVRLQAGNLFRQDGKIWVSDTIRTSGFILGSNLLTVSTSSAQALSGNNTSTGRGLFAQAVGNNAAMLSNTSNDSSSARIVNNGNAEIASFENSFGDVFNINNDGGLQQFNQGSGFWGRLIPTTLSANRTYTLPNGSGTIALTSDSTAILSQVVRTYGAQTVGGVKTFTNNIIASSNITASGDSISLIKSQAATTSFNVRNPNSSGEAVFKAYGSDGVVGTFGVSGSAVQLASNTGGQIVLAPSGNIAVSLTSNISMEDTTTFVRRAVFQDSIVGVSQRLTGGANFATSSGSVGVGTNNPLSKFHVNTGTNQNFRVRPGTDVGATNGVALNSRTDDDASLQQISFRASDAVFLLSGNLISTSVYNNTVGATNRDVFVDNTGILGYVSSFRASKKNIQPLGSTSWLHKLNPVEFNYRVKKDGKYTDSAYKELEYGLIAEEVEPINKEMVFYDVDSTGKHLRGVHYSKLIIPLLKEVQDQKKTITDLEARIAKLEELIKLIKQ